MVSTKKGEVSQTRVELEDQQGEVPRVRGSSAGAPTLRRAAQARELLNM